MSYSKNLKRTFAAGCSVVTLMAFGVVGASAQQEKGSQQQSPGTSAPSAGGGAPASESKQGGDAKSQSSGSGRVEGNAKGETGTKSGAAKQGSESGEKSAQPGRTDDGNADKKADKKGRADAGKEEGGKSTTQSQSDTKAKRDEKKTTDKSEKDEKKAQQASPSKNDSSGTKNEQSSTTKNDGSDAKSPASQSTQKSPGTNQGNQQGQAQPKDGATQPATPGQQQPRQTTDQGGTAPRNAQLDDSQRVQFRQTIIQDRNAPRVNTPSFTVSIGTRIPRDVRLVALPAALITIAPAYREYRYFVTGERIVIVEPSTYEIVEVIDEGNRGPARGTRDQSASIDLNPDQRQVVLRLVRRDAPRANINIGLALGGEVPQSVELIEFPTNVISEISDLREYRYVVVEDNVVVVNPRNRVIVLLVRGQPN